MEKLMILLMAFCLSVACNNNKGDKNGDTKSKIEMNRDKEENKNDNKSKDSTGENKKTWPSNEVKGFIAKCVPAAEKNGMTYIDAQSYCNCMLYKLQNLYPDINDPRLKSISMDDPIIKQAVQNCQPGQ